MSRARQGNYTNYSVPNAARATIEQLPADPPCSQYGLCLPLVDQHPPAFRARLRMAMWMLRGGVGVGVVKKEHGMVVVAEAQRQLALIGGGTT